MFSALSTAPTHPRSVTITGYEVDHASFLKSPSIITKTVYISVASFHSDLESLPVCAPYFNNLSPATTSVVWVVPTVVVATTTIIKGSICQSRQATTSAAPSMRCARQILLHTSPLHAEAFCAFVKDVYAISMTKYWWNGSCIDQAWHVPMRHASNPV